jgi:hypothetical protein
MEGPYTTIFNRYLLSFNHPSFTLTHDNDPLESAHTDIHTNAQKIVKLSRYSLFVAWQTLSDAVCTRLASKFLKEMRFAKIFHRHRALYSVSCLITGRAIRP